MLTSFTVKNFRLFDDLTVESLSRINLIAGKNNVGKTSLLEAMWIYSGATNATLSIGVSSHRGIAAFPSTAIWDNLFRSFDTQFEISMSATQELQPGYILRITLEESAEIRIPVGDEQKSNGGKTKEGYLARLDYRVVHPNGEISIQTARLDTDGIAFENTSRALIDTIFLPARSPVNPNEQADRYRAIEERLDEGYVIRGIQVIEPRIVDIRAAFAGQIPTYQCKVNMSGLENRRIPLNYLGSGVFRFFEILSALVVKPGGILLIDEIENGIHHSVMPKVWQAIDQLAEELDVQVFATTHSLECIQAAYEALKDRGSLRLHRLQLDAGKIGVMSYSDEALAGAIEYEIEVR
jgi:AAA15 family ATPase/GTPase